MEREEVELLPSGLVSCLLNDKEVRILKISPRRLTVRVDDEIDENCTIKIAFFIFDEYRYEEVTIKDYNIIEKTESDFYFTYVFSINNAMYLQNVRNIIKDYSKYIVLKKYGDDNEFSKEMVQYPAELDYEFYKYYLQQKKEWMRKLNYPYWHTDIMDSLELAVTLDNDILYEKYLNNDIKSFKDYYFKENFADHHKLFQKDISRIYIGNEFCHNLFPTLPMLIDMMEKANEEDLQVTLCFTYMRECYIEKTKDIIDKVYNWCKENHMEIEVVVNDWGMLKLIEDKTNYIKVSLGVLLNKRKKDPRYIYNKGYNTNKKIMALNSLNNSIFTKFLKDCKIERYEYENCGYRMFIAKGNHSLHIPFYQTNTSQYCPLYAMCVNQDRGNQEFVSDCPKYCEDYVFAYPKHLKMVGRYNSLFAFDGTLLKNPEELEYYVSSGIDRIVLNFI